VSAIGTDEQVDRWVIDDDFSAMAREVYGAPAGSKWLQVEALGDIKTPRELSYFRLQTIVPPPDVFMSGKRKGQRNIAKRDRSLDREFIVPFKDFDAFVAKRKAAQP
jgi:hypothetical protein